jgi:hypothetical protein
MRYLPNIHEETRKADKEAIATVLKTFADTPLTAGDVTALLKDVPKEVVNGLLWRMANNKTKWPNIKRTNYASYVWDSKARPPRTPRPAKHKTVVKHKVEQIRPVVEAPVAKPAEWETITTIEDKIIIRRHDGTVWVAKPLSV